MNKKEIIIAYILIFIGTSCFICSSVIWNSWLHRNKQNYQILKFFMGSDWAEKFQIQFKNRIMWCLVMNWKVQILFWCRFVIERSTKEWQLWGERRGEDVCWVLESIHSQTRGWNRCNCGRLQAGKVQCPQKRWLLVV